MREVFVVIALIFTLGIVTLFGYKLMSSMFDAFNASGFGSSTTTALQASFLLGLRILDYLIVIFAILLILGVAITTYRLATAPVFFLVNFIMAAFEGLIAYVMSYIFIQISSNSVFSTVVTLFPRTILLCSNLHWVALLTIIVGSITLYAKRESGQFVEG